jgi:putative ABC transport system ATP-binding protein
MMRDIVIAENLTKVYGSGVTSVTALKDINLRVKEGEFLAIQGTSGSGKSTLLNQLGALDRPTSGRLIIDDVDITSIPESKLFRIRRDKIGFIFQVYYLIPGMTALENVLIPLLPQGIKGEHKKRAEELLEMVGLKERISHKPGELSGGQQQRVAVARALVTNPAIVLADEPTGNLDSKTKVEILDLMRRLNQEQGMTFIVVTHDASIAADAGRVVYLRDGELFTEPIAE